MNEVMEEVLNFSHFDEYQHEASKTNLNTQSGSAEIARISLGLSGEVGEIHEHLKKWFRGDFEEIDTNAMRKELGDLLWYMSQFAALLGIEFSSVAELNVRKLRKRALEGTIQGNGSDR